MKLTKTIFLLISVSVFGQENSMITYKLFISGHLELIGNDKVSKNRIGLMTSVNTKDSVMTRPFDIADDGYFKIDKLNSGTYKLIFRVNKDYKQLDTLVTITKENLLDLRLRLIKKPCGYNAQIDINESKLKIFTLSGISPRVNNKADNAFERSYKVKYIILGDSNPESWNCFEKYNEVIYQFLDNKYGKKWRKTVRDDAVGLK